MNFMNKLLTAVFTHNLSEIQSLLAENENIEIKDKDGRTPLLYAVIKDSIPIVTVLLDHGADINVQDKLGWSALHFASQNQSIEMTKLLIQHGSIIDAVDAYGNTSLARATFTSRGRGEVIQLLLEAGADKEKKNNYGNSPLDLAKKIANYDVLQFLVEKNS
jgi:uncharacterized protein